MLPSSHNSSYVYTNDSAYTNISATVGENLSVLLPEFYFCIIHHPCAVFFSRSYTLNSPSDSLGSFEMTLFHLSIVLVCVVLMFISVLLAPVKHKVNSSG